MIHLHFWHLVILALLFGTLIFALTRNRPL